MEENKNFCDSEVSKLQKQFDAIVLKLEEINKNYGKTLKENLERKNAEVSEKKIRLRKEEETGNGFS